MKWLFFLLTGLCFLSCNQQDQSSPFSDILSSPPYVTLTDSIRKQPKRDDLYFRRAVLLNKNNLPEPALADFQQAWRINKEENYALGVSNILLDKQPAAAAEFLQSALIELPKSIFLHIILARALDAQHKTDEAIAVCDKILAIDSAQINTLVLKADLLEKKQDIPGAVVLLEKVYMLVPGNLELANKLAYQYAESKNPKTIAFCDQLLVRDSLKLHAEPYYVKGVYYTNTGNQAKAIEAFNQAIRSDHRMLNAYIEKGKIFLDQKNIAEALKTFQLANTISPAFPDAWYWIGQCQEALGQKEEAKLNYEKAYGLDKTFTEAKEAAAKL